MTTTREWLPIKRNHLKRERLNTLFHEGLANSMITVIAGSGYGKTQGAATFVSELNERVAWIQLNKYANNPSRFWEVFVRALKQELPDLAEQLTAMDFPDSPSEMFSFLRMFADNLYEGEQVVLVVDDFQNINNPEITAFFECLVEMELENFCLIMISEKKTELSVVGLKSCSGLFSITAQDLKFTREEAAQFFFRKELRCRNPKSMRLLPKPMVGPSQSRF